MKKIYILSLLFAILLFQNNLFAQVTVNASSGTLTGTYTTLKAAFDAINAGTHKGDINIDISASTTETAPATLNSSDADPAAYNYVLIQPVADNVVISGAPGAGFGVVQLNGADNVIFSGDNPNSAGNNRDLTIENTSAATVLASSVIRIATRPGVVVSANDNFILNCKLNGNVTAGNASGITSATSSANISFGIYCGGNAGTSSTSAPAAISTTTPDPAANTTTINNLVLDNNEINRCGRGIAFNGAVTSVSGSLTITNNVIGASGALGTYPYTTPATTIYSKGIWIAGTDAVYINSNTIRNILSYLATSIVGIELNSAIGSSLIDVSANTITGVVNNSTTNDAFGVLVSAAANKFSIAANTITTVQNSATASVAGIKIATGGGQASITQNKVSGIFARNTGGYGAFGVQLATSANGAEISNNFIYDIMNVGSASFNNTDNAAGIIIASGSNHKIYHNSVSLYGNNTGPGSNLMSCLHVTSSAITGLDIRNNIFSNTVTSAGATDAHVCLFLPFAASGGLNYKINNNAYYTGNTAGKHGIAQVISTGYNAANILDVASFNASSTTPAANFRNYSSALGNTINDFASFGSTLAAPFTSITDLHIPAATVTRLESGAVPVGISVDIDNGVRSGTTPDIGADEFVGTPQDLTPPLISYTPLVGTCVLTARTLTATITDASGVGSGANQPRLWWKINAGAYTLAPAPTIAGNNFTFTFGAGVVVGDIVSYYIVAQDNAATPNVISQSSVGAGGFTASPPAAATPPTSPDSYGVQNNLPPGTYTVGVAGAYTTLTAAVNAYNTSCLSGAVIFNLTDATYPSETYPIVIGNPVANATNTLRIKPNTSASLTGASPIALFKLSGADYVTIDGSNAGLSDQNLTITNTDPGTNSAVIWVASAGSNGATNNAVKNCIISGNASTTTFFGIVSSSGTTVNDVAESANSNNTYLNNAITTSLYGIALIGTGTGESGNLVSNNKIGSATVANKLGFRGLFLSNQTGVSVNGNLIFGITSNQASITDVTAGITVRGNISGGNIFNNIISDIKNTNTGGWTADGITLQAATTTSNLTVYNNFIYDVAGYGWASRATDNGFGIGVMGGGGYKIYYNSINLTTNQTISAPTAAMIITADVTTPATLDIRNNIFADQQTTGTRYGVYSNATAAVLATINYNDYYAQNVGFLGAGRNTLAAWQTATGGDGNSVAVDPVYISATNLHLKNTSPSSTLDGQATPIAGMTNDIDGNPRNVTTPDIGADEFTPDPCGGIITGGTVTASQTNVCVSAPVSFASTGFSTGTGMTYQWESSPNGSAPWSAIPGETNPSGVSITVSVTTYYRLTATCTLTSTSANSNVIQVTVTTPSIVSSTGGSVCGLGTVNLTAAGSAGTSVYWYANLSGGLPLLNNSNYTTPVINSTTTYYAEAVAGAANGFVGPTTPTTQGGTIGTQTVSWDVGFNVIQATTLLSVDVYPIAAGGSGTLNVYNSANAILASIPYTYTVSGGATAQTIPINLALPVGNGYYIEDPSLFLPGSGATRNTSGAVYPYTSSAINITGNGFDQSYYMCYYNWQFSSGCASAPRTAVVATVSTPPPYTAPVASAPTVCEGSSSNITGADADYSIYSWLPTSGLSNAAIANPVATPAATTTYTVTASNGTCATSASITINVNPIPGALSITPANPAVCAGTSQSLTATGGAGNFFRERFEAFPISKFVVTGTGITESQSTTYYQEGTSSVRLSYQANISDANPGSYEMANNLNLSLYSNPVLTFQHIGAFERFSGTNYDFGYVEYSTDGGANYTPFPTTSYSGAGTLSNGVVSFSNTSYANWATQFTSSGSTPGASPGTALWKLETLDLSPWQASTQFRIRFRITSDINGEFYGWMLDDIKINGQASITWGPTTELFTDAGTIIAYTGTNNPVVYVKPTATRLYTATATFGTCSATATVTPAVTANNISLSIATATTTVCAGYPVAFTISAQNIQGSPSPFYDWQINGVTATGNGTGASSAGTTVTVASTANLHVGMRVSVTAGTGAFQANTRIVSITNGTQFVVSATPISALSGATISAVANGSTVTSLTYTGLANGDVVTCVLTVGGVTCVVPVTGTVTSNALAFTVNPSTPSSVSIGASPAGPICSGTSVTFTATPTNGGLAPTYEWFVGAVSQGAPSGTATFTSTTLTNGAVVTCRMVSNATNCPLPNPSVSAGVTMTVGASFPVSVSLSANPGTGVCAGTSVTFTATPVNGGGSPLYEFFVDGISQGAASSTPTFTSSTLTDLQVVTCVLTSSIGSAYPACASGNPATSPGLTMNITTLTVTVALSPVTAICTGTPRTYTATATNGGGSPLYEFFVNTVSQGAPSGTNTFTYTPVNGDLVEVHLQSSLGGCAVPNPATTSFTQTVNLPPTTAITGGNTLCPGIPVLLNSNAVAGSGTISTIQWKLGGVDIGGATSTTYIATAAGNYTVAVTNSNTCTVTSAIFTITASPSLMAGSYTIGAITATGASSAGTTVTVASTANLVVGAALTKVSGTGTLAANTLITSIVNATTFTVNTAPTVALSAAAVAGATCTNYISFASAISDLNTRAISNNCVFDVTAGYVENITGQLVLGSNAGPNLNNTVAGKTIIFQKAGVGTNPKIQTAFAGVNSSNSGTVDGIWSLNGIDNVTVDGIDLTDNNVGTTAAMMEFGYGLFKLTVTDGAQNNTIKNCVITLNKANNAVVGTVMAEGSVGIAVSNSLNGTANTPVTPTAASGTNSNNKFYKNSIQNCNIGVALRGYLAPSPFTLGDTGNDVGGTSGTDGNTITNFGSGGTIQAMGVRITNQWSANIAYNTITSNAHNGILKGIWGEVAVSANININNNIVTVVGGGTTQTVNGIENAIGSTAAANTVNINNNTVTGSYTTATSGTWTGISNAATAANVNMNFNTVQNVTLPGSLGNTLIGITSTAAIASGNTLKINNNTVTNNTKTASVSAITLTLTPILVSGPVAGSFVEVKTNTISNNNVVGGGNTVNLFCISMVSAGTVTATDNIVNNNSVTGMSGATVATIHGYSNGSTTATENVNNNTISNLFVTTSTTSTGLHAVNGIRHNTVNTSVRSVSGNTIFNLYSGSAVSAVITGINSSSVFTLTCQKNKIYNLFPGQSSATGSIAKGISIAGGAANSTWNVSNNMISIDLTLAAAATSSVAANSVLNGAEAIRGVEITSAPATSTINFYYNAIRLAGNGIAGFGATGMFHTTNTTATTAALNMRNNILVNLCTPNGGIAAAYRRNSTTLTNYASTSNNNVLYAGTPSASKLLFYDGTNSDQLIGTYKTRVSTRDAASISELPVFLDPTTGDLRLNPDNCSLDGAGAGIAGYADDYEGTVRATSGATDIGADEFTSASSVSLTVTNPAGVCSGGSIDLTAAGVTAGSTGGTAFYYYSDAGGTTVLPTPNNITVSGTYYIKYGKGNCYSAVTPVLVVINPVNTWLGVNTNWFDNLNWCPGVPGPASDITIPGSLSNYPVITTTGPAAQVRNITIATGASVTLTGAGVLDVKGNLVNNGTLTNDGEISMTGNTAQTIPGAAGTVVAMKKLAIANTGGGVTINKDLRIADVITPTSGAITLNNVYITLRSTADSTARVGNVGTATFAYTGTGNFVVERYFPARRAWRLLTAPVVSSASKTVFNSWQAAGNNSISGNATYVSGPSANPATNGLDVSPLNNSSLKKFNFATSGFDAVLDTRTALLPAFPAGNTATYNVDISGYFVFVRGDRTPANTAPFDPYVIGTSTVLRDTGAIKTGNFIYNCNPGSGANIYTLIGNPYASPVDFTSLTRNNLANKFTVWDPNLNTVGGYVVWNAGVVTPASIQTNIIQSKQAFVVEATGAAPTLTFGEGSKSAINNPLLFRPAPLPAGSFTTDLYLVNADGSRKLADGVLAQFNDEYSAGSDVLDAVKFTNVNETFSIKNGSNYFIQDRRPFLQLSDTLFFSLTRSKARKYGFNVTIDNIMRHRNRVAYLEDKYLHTATALNMQGSTWVDFEVNSDAASAAAGRFMVTFKKVARFNHVGANPLYNDVAVKWSIDNAELINQYEVERSSDGKAFEKVGELAGKDNAAALNDYNLLDLNVEPGVYYYRVKAISNSYASYEYSDVVKVKVVKSKAELYVYPNPVTDGLIGLRMNTASTEGRYGIRLVNGNGQAVMMQQLQHAKTGYTELITYPSYIAGGTYQLEVTGPDKKKTVIAVVIAKQ